jgi:putative nucleotidyltransferase with HDIG domain
VTNSAAYFTGTRNFSIQQALLRLGLFHLREIVIAVAFKCRIFEGGGHEHLMRKLWRNSAGTGAFAKEIALLLEGDPENAFLCGLLHDVGKPVVLLALVDLERELRQKLRIEELLDTLDDLHATVGVMIADQLALPPQVKEAISYYTRYNEAPSYADEAKVICLANRLSKFSLESGEFDEQEFRNHPIFADLDLTDGEINTLLTKREKVIQFVDAFQ